MARTGLTTPRKFKPTSGGTNLHQNNSDSQSDLETTAEAEKNPRRTNSSLPLTPNNIILLQRTAGNQAVLRLLAKRKAEPAQVAPIQRKIMTKDEMVRFAGGSSRGISKSAYDKVLAALSKYPTAALSAKKVELLNSLITNIDGWLTKNKDRQKARDAQKRQFLPVLKRQVQYELQVVNNTVGGLDPLMKKAFVTDLETVTYLRNNIASYAAIQTNYELVFPGRKFDAMLVNHFEGRFKAIETTLDRYYTLVEEFSSSDEVKKVIAKAYENVAGHAIRLQGLDVPKGNQSFKPKKIDDIKTLFTKVMTDVKYDSLSIPLQFIEKVREVRKTEPQKSLTDILAAYNADLDLGDQASPGKADCVGMANELKGRLKTELAVDCYVIGSKGSNYLNSLPDGRHKVEAPNVKDWKNARDHSIWGHASIIVPFTNEQGKPEYIHMETAHGPDPENFRTFANLSEKKAREKDSLTHGDLTLKGDLDLDKPIENAEEFAKKHIRVKWRLYLTNDPDVEGGRAYIDLIDGSIYLGGRGKGDMDLAKTFKTTYVNFEDMVKHPTKSITLSMPVSDDVGAVRADVPKTNAEALPIFFTLIKKQFNLPDGFVENMLYLAQNLDAYGQEVLLDPISSLRQVAPLKRQALGLFNKALPISEKKPLPASFDEKKFEQAKTLVRDANNDAIGKNVIEASKKYQTLIALLKSIMGNHEVATGLEAAAKTNKDDPAALETAVMSLIKTKGKDVADVDELYTRYVKPLGLPVPDHIGVLAHDFFVKEFTAKGNGKAVYQQLVADFPSLSYRLKPAYRLVFGERQLQTMLRELETDELNALVPDPTGVDNQAAKNKLITHGKYKAKDFKSATGIGNAFDAEYDPATGQLKILVKIYFNFIDGNASAYDAPIEANEVGDQYSKTKWDDPAKLQYIADFKAKAVGPWNSAAAVIKCVRPGWTGVQAVTSVAMESVGAPDVAHYKVDARKANLQYQDRADKAKGKKLQGVGRSGGGGKDFTLQEWDVADKIADPSVHHYLHKAEKEQNIEPAYRQDRNRQEVMLRDFGKLEFLPNNPNTLKNPSRLTILIEELKRMQLPSSLANLHPLQIEGATADALVTAAPVLNQRAAYVKGQLTTNGITNPVKEGVSAEAYEGAIVKSAPADPAVLDTYDTNWQRISAAHEFGHMIGLMDEYYQAASDKVVKKLISDGLLPPDTPGDHFTRHPPKGVPESQKGKQEATLDMLEQSNLAAPALTVGSAEAPKTTNIMTGGHEITANNFVTFWEVLTNMTKDEVDPKFWKIGSGRGATH